MSRLFETRPGDDGLPGPQRRIAVWVLILGTLMAVLDANMVNIALPTLARDLDVEPSLAVWIVNLYQLVGAVSLIAFAALSELVTRRLLYIGGLVVFTLASLGCALAREFEPLLIWRALQGLGAAAMLSIGPSLYRSIFPSRLLGSALGISAMVVALGYASGPSLGGVLLTVADWPWLFALNVPVGCAVLLLAWRTLPREPHRSRGFDVLGALLSAVTLGALVMAMDGLGRAAGAMEIVGLLLLGAACGWGFVQRQRRARYPLLPLSIFAEPRFSLAAVVSNLAFIAQGLAFVCLSFLYQNVMGYSPLETAWLFTPWPLAIMLIGPPAGRLADRFNATLLASLGLALLLVGLALLAMLENDATIVDILWRTALCGLGFGLYQSPNNRELLSSVPRSLSANASGVMSTVRTFGQSLGVALVGVVLAWPGASVQAALWLGCVAVALALLVSVRRIPMTSAPFRDESSERPSPGSR